MAHNPNNTAATELLDAARAYTSRGYRVVPIPAGQKGPRIKGWPDLRLGESDLPLHFNGTGNIGVLLGEPSGGLVDVDLDCDEAVELADDYLPATGAVTGRGTRTSSHRWYRCDGATTVKHRDPVTGKMIVEIRSTGAQTLVGPSRHPCGDVYDELVSEPARVGAPLLAASVTNLAQAIIERRHGQKEATASPPPTLGNDRFTAPSTTDIERRAGAYLDAMAPGVSGCGGHNATYAAATAMAHGFGLDPEAALRLLLDRYNPRCQPPWSEKELRHKVEDAASKSHSRPFGWLRDAQSCDSDVNLSALSMLTSPAGQTPAKRQVDHDPFPSRFLDVPGLIGELIHYDLSTATRPQPALALAGAISVQAVLAGRKVRDERGNRTNLYCVGVARTGAGKNNALRAAQRLLHAAGLERHMWTGGIASDAGLVKSVENEPARLFLIDEFGRFLRTIGDPRSQPFLYNIVTTLMALYSAAESVYATKAYADDARNKVIDQPCVSLLGMTTPGRFYESLTSDSVQDGFLGRLLIFETNDLPKRARPHDAEPPETLVESARWWGEFNPTGNLHNEHPKPLVVKATHKAETVFDALADTVDACLAGDDEVEQALWARAEEKACRLALVYACSANREKPVIDEPTATWACGLADYLTRRLLHAARHWIAESVFDARQKQILRIVHDAGGQVTRSDLWRRTRSWSAREREEVVHNMQLTEQIDVETIETGGRPRTIIRVCEGGENDA